jgi:amidase
MARYVADLAYTLNAIVGSDREDSASVTRPPTDYAASLDASALTGARFGVLRDYMGRDAAQDAVLETTVAMLRNAGAEVIDVSFPSYLVNMTSRGGFYETIRDVEFRNQIDGYLKTVSGTSPPRTHADILRLSEKLTAPSPEGWLPNPGRLAGYRREAKLGSLDDQGYLSARNEGMRIVRDVLTSVLRRDRLDAFIGLTSRVPARLITEEGQPLDGPTMGRLASLSGWPDLTVPMGFTSNPPLPVGLSFLGPLFSESKLLSYGHAFQRHQPMTRLPVSTPALPGEQFDY